MKRFFFCYLFIAASLSAFPTPVDQAIAAYQDQKEREAFSLFIEELSTGNPSNSGNPSVEEKIHYEKALKLYLKHHGTEKFQQVSKKIIADYQEIVDRHPEYALLDFLVAASYANQGNFEEFFPRFYRSYQQYPDSYMAHRTLAILHLKLLQKTPHPDARQSVRQKIYLHAHEASRLYPEDTSLYHLMITYSEKEKKGDVVRESLRKILEENMMVPRKDVPFFTKSALETDQEELAVKFVGQAKTHYDYSRMVEKAEKLIERHKKRSK